VKLGLTSDGRVTADVRDKFIPAAERQTHFVQVGDEWKFDERFYGVQP
jgi:hypothetical protein